MHRSVLWLVLAGAMAAGCSARSVVERDRVTFAVLSGVYYSASPGAQVEGAVPDDSDWLLRKAVADLNATKNLDFALLSGNLLARADALSLDRVKAILDELRVPYCMVLGEYDGPRQAESPAAVASAATATATGGPGAKAAAAIGCISRSGVIWAFQGHGFSGASGYWSQEIVPGVVVVGLDTVRPGGTQGHVGPEQLAWLDRTLAANAGKAVILVSHHGIVPVHPLDEGAAWRHMMIDNAAAVQQVLDRHTNVVMAVMGQHNFAEKQVSGRVVYLSTPSVSVWPLAYTLVRLAPKEAEATWVPLGGEDLSRRAQERLLASPKFRGVFPAGDDGDTACVRLFGGRKMETYPLPGIRP